MGIITKNKTWADNENVLFTDLNADFDTLYNEFNGNIDNNNIKSGAGIVESKILFSSGGHGHTGGSDGKQIVVNRGYGFFLPGTPSVGNDSSWNPAAPAAQTATKLAVHAKQAPTGASFIGRIYNVTQAAVVATITLGIGATDANTTSMTTAAINANDVLRCDVTQQGSTVLAGDVSFTLNVSQP